MLVLPEEFRGVDCGVESYFEAVEWSIIGLEEEEEELRGIVGRTRRG
jgi:hypothetical protein